MKGMYRKIDQLGRIVLPVKIRRSFGLKPGSEVDIEAGSIGIMLSPRNVQRCEFCAGTADLLTVEGVTLCRGCATRLAEAARGGWGTK